MKNCSVPENGAADVINTKREGKTYLIIFPLFRRLSSPKQLKKNFAWTHTFPQWFSLRHFSVFFLLILLSPLTREKRKSNLCFLNSLFSFVFIASRMNVRHLYYRQRITSFDDLWSSFLLQQVFFCVSLLVRHLVAFLSDDLLDWETVRQKLKHSPFFGKNRSF